MELSVGSNFGSSGKIITEKEKRIGEVKAEEESLPQGKREKEIRHYDKLNFGISAPITDPLYFEDTFVAKLRDPRREMSSFSSPFTNLTRLIFSRHKNEVHRKLASAKPFRVPFFRSHFFVFRDETIISLGQISSFAPITIACVNKTRAAGNKF